MVSKKKPIDPVSMFKTAWKTTGPNSVLCDVFDKNNNISLRSWADPFNDRVRGIVLTNLSSPNSGDKFFSLRNWILI